MFGQPCYHGFCTVEGNRVADGDIHPQVLEEQGERQHGYLCSALRWMEWITASQMIADSPIFRDQVRDPPKWEKNMPRPLDENVIITLEKLVKCAETPQLWCAADLRFAGAHLTPWT